MKNRGAVVRSCVLGLFIGTVGSTFAVPPNSGIQARNPADEGGKKDEKKETIPVDKLPKAVVDSVKKAMPGARITKAAKIMTGEKLTYYLDDVKVGKKGWDVTVGPDGAILRKEECKDND